MLENSVSELSSGGDPHHTHLIIMTKFPEPGKVKTRLGATIGNEASCRLHRVMVQHLLEKTLPLLENIEVRFHVAGGTDQDVTEWLGDYGSHWQRQIESDLGEKMQHAISASLHEGADKVLIIGTDCPAITPAHIHAVVTALDDHDVAFTPALDGGYVMAGMKAIHLEMFQNITWSTDSVLEISTQRLNATGRSVKVLDSLRDIDTAADLDHAAEILGGKFWEE